jgi:hypothetical protein
MSSVNSASDQNGYAGMNASWTIALSRGDQDADPAQALDPHADADGEPAWHTLRMISAQPYVLRFEMTNWASLTKNFEFDTAARPSMKFSTASRPSIDART